jgi:hypothetical protein
MKCFELVFIQNNPLYDVDDNDGHSNQQYTQEQLRKTTLDANEDKVVQFQRDQIQHSLSKPIIRLWDEIRNNKHREGIEYDKEVNFHTPDYSKPIQFQSVGFRQKVLSWACSNSISEC